MNWMTLGLYAGSVLGLVLALSLAMTTGRSSGSVFRRSWSGSFADKLAEGVERAILEVQAIEQPEKRHSLNEVRSPHIPGDEGAGPDDPKRTTREQTPEA